MLTAYIVLLILCACVWYKVKREEDRLYEECMRLREERIKAENATRLPRPNTRIHFGSFYGDPK